MEAPRRSQQPGSSGTTARGAAYARVRTIWLVGMMGAGKTSVGRRLAERLRRRFVDTDHEIEREAGLTVARIFEQEGESGFRARERRAIELVEGEDAVVSLGGGAMAQPGIAERLAATGTIVYLRARPETLVRRVGSAEMRPLLRGLDPAARLEKLAGLLRERGQFYERAQVVIDTDEHDVDRLAGELARRLGGDAS